MDTTMYTSALPVTRSLCFLIVFELIMAPVGVDKHDHSHLVASWA